MTAHDSELLALGGYSVTTHWGAELIGPALGEGGWPLEWDPHRDRIRNKLLLEAGPARQYFKFETVQKQMYAVSHT